MPLLIVRFNSDGALAVIVTGPTPTQLALPLSLTVAMLVFELENVRPSATVRSRLVLLSKVAVTVYCTSVGGLTGADAVCGETVRRLMVGCPAPQAIHVAAEAQIKSTCRALNFMVSPASLDCVSRAGVGLTEGE